MYTHILKVGKIMYKNRILISYCFLLSDEQHVCDPPIYRNMKGNLGLSRHFYSFQGFACCISLT